MTNVQFTGEIKKPPAKMGRPVDFEYYVKSEWEYAGQHYYGQVRIFKLQAYQSNGYQNSGEWRIAVKGHKGTYAETRLTVEAAGELAMKLASAIQRMDNGHPSGEYGPGESVAES